MHDSMVSTALTLPGFRIVKNICVVRSITVRSRSIIGNFFGGLQSLFGGNITIYNNLYERAQADTYQLMCEHVTKQGANAIISIRELLSLWSRIAVIQNNTFLNLNTHPN
jgi:uncharacterized protein YbjQ (UPF0145 family)